MNKNFNIIETFARSVVDCFRYGIEDIRFVVYRFRHDDVRRHNMILGLKIAAECILVSTVVSFLLTIVTLVG